MKTQTLIFTIAAAALTCLLAFSSNGLAARKVCDDGSYPPCRDTGEEGAGNRMSVPAITFSSANPPITAYWDVSGPEGHIPVLGVHYSYGCDKGESDEHFSYPNTSCVDNLMTPTVHYTAERCIEPGAPCEGFAAEELSRIYWQKVAENEWSADQDNIADYVPPSADAGYIDWGDALEAVSWTTKSKIRVETQPYTNLAPPEIFYPAVDEDGNPIYALDENGEPTTIQLTTLGACAEFLDPAECRVGFQMWHVSGQGITEHWGVRATEGAISYNYDSPFQIINTPTARLNIAKMEAASAVCRSPGEGDEGSEPPEVVGWTGDGWENACTWHDAPYSVELSVGGKYVYGYNWDMNTVNTESTCGTGWEATGWWRLTFYTTDDAVVFNDADIPKSAPPAVPAEVRDLDDFAFNTATANFLPAAGELYIPEVDAANNLTYLDICIVAKTQGGGGGGGGGGKPTGKGGGGKPTGGKPGGSAGGGAGSGAGGGSGGRGR